MARQTVWKTMYFEHHDTLKRLEASLSSVADKKFYKICIEDGLGIIETNMPWRLLRHWARFTGVWLPSAVVDTKPSWERYPDEERKP